MRGRRLAPSVKQCAQVAVATVLVAGCPLAVVWWLRASGTVSSAALGVLLAMALSLCASYLGRLVWEKQPGSEDLLFSELMIWGFLHRWRTQRRLASALEMLGPMSDTRRPAPVGVATEQQAKLLEQLVAQIETRDRHLHGHSRRVARHSWMIAKRMGLPPAEVARIRTAAAIHDVGKIKTPKAILHKSGPLTDDEYEVIKCHPGDGALMVAVLGDRELASIVRHHHERLDGTGYPNGLSGEKIPIGARIVAVADTFDAITSARPYRPASAHKRAIDILRDEAGTKLDPAVVRAFSSHYAGRGPLALWALFAGLPERMVSWLGGSVATAASAAKVVGVATLVSGAAVTSSTLALPLGKSYPAGRQGTGTAGAHRPNADSAPGEALVGPGTSAMHGARRVDRAYPIVSPSTRGRSAAPQPAASAVGGSASTHTSASSAADADSGHGTDPDQPDPTGQPPPPAPAEPPSPVELPGEPAPPGTTEPPAETPPGAS